MPKVSLFNRDGEQVGELDAQESLFGAPLKEGAIYQTAVAQAARLRQGNASVKDRSEVRGGGAKPWSQKGTGRARHGSSRSPIWVGGGSVFGPKPRDYSIRVPKKIRRAALTSALSDKLKEGRVLVVEDYAISEPKTKLMAALLKNLNITGGALVVMAEPDQNVIKSSRNLPGVKTTLARQLNVLDILTYNYLVLNQEAFARVEEVFGG